MKVLFIAVSFTQYIMFSYQEKLQGILKDKRTVKKGKASIRTRQGRDVRTTRQGILNFDEYAFMDKVGDMQEQRDGQCKQRCGETRSQKEMLEIKNTILEMKNALTGHDWEKNQ